MKKIGLWLSILLLIFGCGLDTVTMARECAKQYMESFQAGNFQAMYQLVDESTKKKFPYVGFEGMHKAMLAKNGDIKNCLKTELHIDLNPEPGTYKYWVTYEIQFEKLKEKVMYKLVVLIKEGKPWIAQWDVETGNQGEGS